MEADVDLFGSCGGNRPVEIELFTVAGTVQADALACQKHRSQSGRQTRCSCAR